MKKFFIPLMIATLLVLSACSTEVSSKPTEPDASLQTITPQSDTDTRITGYPAIGAKLGVVNKTPGIEYRTTNVDYECGEHLAELELNVGQSSEYNGTTIKVTELTSFDNNLQQDVQDGVTLSLGGNTEKFSEKALSLIVQTDVASRKDLDTFQDDYVVNITPKPTKLESVFLETRSFDYSDRIIGISICMMR